MTKYVIACAIVFAIFIFLKFVEDSPVRSWKVALLGAAVLSGIICAYLNFVIPKPLPTPVKERNLAWKGELERTFRHIEGVDSASIDGMNAKINFAVDKPVSELRRVAHHSGGTAAYFLREEKNFKFTISMFVKGQKRYEVIFGPNASIIGEQEF